MTECVSLQRSIWAKGNLEEKTEKNATEAVLRYPKRAVLIFLITVVAGPPLGSLAVLGPFYVSSLKPDVTLTQVGSAVGFAVFFGYIFGGVRACLAGLWIAYRVWRDGTVSYLECVDAALGATLIGSIYLLVVSGPDGWGAALLLSLFLCAAALVAAVACRWIAGRIGILPR